MGFLRRVSVVLLFIGVVIGGAKAPPSGAAAYTAANSQTQRAFRILVSNDDGVRAPGIAALAQELKSIGEVTIVAPAENQSGKGHSISIAEPIFRDEVVLAGGLRATSLTATPV